MSLLLLFAPWALPLLTAQPTAPAPSTTLPTSFMKNFVIIFRQGPHPLADSDKQQRAKETSLWARRYNAAGHKLDPHILEPERALRGMTTDDPAGAAQVEGWPVTALLFLAARDLDEATKIAGAHPALNYGSVVEVRAWASPVVGEATVTAAAEKLVVETGSVEKPATAR